jgi:cytochrome c
MKRSWLILLAATWSSVALMAGRDVPAAESIDIDLTQWTPPDISTVADDPFGRLVKYGHALFTDTANEIGPAVSDPTRRFAGNNLTCQNCHLQAGTQPSKIASTVAWSAA